MQKCEEVKQGPQRLLNLDAFPPGVTVQPGTDVVLEGFGELLHELRPWCDDVGIRNLICLPRLHLPPFSSELLPQKLLLQFLQIIVAVASNIAASN